MYSDTYTNVSNPYETTLPSQETYQEIEEITELNSSLRAAPPGGNPIGGVPLGMPSLLILGVPFILYFIYKKIKNRQYA